MDAQLKLFVVNVEGFFVLFMIDIFVVDICVIVDWSQPGLERERGGQ